MSFGLLTQILIDLVLFAGVAFLWVKLMRPQKDDPRLSRGLQLLQSKIAVLEDLSDQIETQVQQLTSLIEIKAKDVQAQIVAADKQIQKIEASMAKSLEVAQIFQDRIPHQEIIERQNTVKYVKAARLAHQGRSLEEIAEEVDLSRGEIEMIAKVNRDQLQFSEEELPEWAKNGESGAGHAIGTEANAGLQRPEIELKPLARVQDRPDLSLSSLGEKFRQNVSSSAGASPFQEPKPVAAPTIEMPSEVKLPPSKEILVRERATTTAGKSVEIQKVVFPKINMTDHLS